MVSRIVLAAPASGSGKTTIAFGLMAALRARGLAVAPFKVGPDYIDPGYHALATGRPGRNLDPWLVGEQRIAPLLLHGAQDADVAIVEGVMGLFDGRRGVTDHRRGFGSTAHVAELIDAPVVLIVDAAHSSRTAAAVAHGLATFPGAPRIGGVILNGFRAGRSRADLDDAFAAVGLPILGAVPRSQEAVVPSRHLGLVPADERDQAADAVAAAASLIAEHIDLDAVLALAATAPPLEAEAWNPAAEVARVAGRPRVAVAAGRAFTFRYAETTELMEAAGCEVVAFDPALDPHLPAGTAALYLGGGFPEVYAETLAANVTLRTEVAAALAAGLPTYAECAGLLYLCRTLDGQPMASAVDLDAAMSPRLTLGYREATASASVATRAGEVVRSHEFHRTGVAGDGLNAWTIDERREGLATGSLLASYQHVHWAGYPAMASRFAAAAAAFAASGRRWLRPAPLPPVPPPDLAHHGDADLAEGLIDLAVNVREHVPPAWLAEAIARPGRWASYPDAKPARAALAARHGVDPALILPTAGAAEAFGLIARALTPAHPVVVHPQFTEPEAALALAGAPVRRVLLRAPGFILDPALIPEAADLVVLGNPTNPTGVLHPAEAVRALLRPGRVVVVDEAFADFVPGEPASLIAPEMAGLLVTRSLTKMWGVAGLRAGYVAGDPALLARLAAQQPPWAVGTPALDAMIACSTPAALAQADIAALDLARHRDHLVTALTQAGFAVAGEAGAPSAPFVLVDTSPLGPGSVREALAARGFAVRRGESFPGLGRTWIRLAVRSPEISDAVAAALGSLRPQ